MHTLPFNDQDIFIAKTKSITLFALSILISACIHIAVVIFVNDNHCFDCNNTTDIATKPLSIQLYKEPPPPPIIEVTEQIVEQKTVPLANITQTSKNQTQRQ